MTITVRFVGQTDGKSTLGYYSQWRLDQDDRDPVTEAVGIRSLNASHPLANEFNRFVTWDQYYSHEVRKKDPETGREITYLDGFSGESEKRELVLL